MGSLLYVLNGIFNNPSRYCFALMHDSSDLPFISFNLAIAFSLTDSGAFNIYICCSNVI